MNSSANSKILLPLLLAIVSLTSCFHKSVMNDNADDIIANTIYVGPEGTYVLSWEEIFQATSKESGGGYTQISGYAERRISSYNIATGELAGRVELGEVIDEGNALLGWSPGKVWMYSIEEELGLHYRNPVTLEVIQSWEQLRQKPGLDRLSPAKAEWSNISTYFAFDWEAGKVMLTDLEGFRYELDPETMELKKTDRDLPRSDWDEDPFGSTGEFDENDSYSMDGDTRKEISFRGKKSGMDVSFLSGEYIHDRDPRKEGVRQKERRTAAVQRVTTLRDSLKRFEAAHPEATQEPNWSTWSMDQREIHRVAEETRRDLQDAERDLERLDSWHDKVLDYPLLTGDRKSAYLRYASSLSDTAHTVIARVKFNADTTWTIQWSSHLHRFYFDPSKADDAGAFETVFSKGNPEFDYAWAGTDGKHLVLVGQLHMACLDMETGKVLWEKQI